VVLIDGDHALLSALDAPALSRSYGGQVLQIVYHFESIIGAKRKFHLSLKIFFFFFFFFFLSHASLSLSLSLITTANFSERKVSIHVVFFRRNESALWHAQPVVQLARRVAIGLLTRARPDITVHLQYEHAGDERWLAYTAPLSFVFATTYTFAPSCEPSAVLKALLEATVLTYLTWSRCASLLELSFCDANAYGFITKQSYAPVAPIVALLERAYAAVDAANALVPQIAVTLSTTDIAAQLSKLLADARAANLAAPERQAAAALVAAQLLRAGADVASPSVVRAWTVAVATASALPLEARSALHPDASAAYPAAVATTIAAVARCSCVVYDALDAAGVLDGGAVAALADSVDGRWLHVTLSFLAHNNADGKALSDSVLFAWKQACALASVSADAAAALAGVPALRSDELPSDAAPIDAVPPEQRTQATADADDAQRTAAADISRDDTDVVPPILPIVDRLGALLAGADIADSLPKVDTAAAATLTARAKQLAHSFIETTTWKGCEYILHEATNLLLKRKEDEESASMSEKQRMRQKQKYLAFQQRYASGLEGTTALAGKRTGPLVGALDAAAHAASTTATDDNSNNAAPRAVTAVTTRRPTPTRRRSRGRAVAARRPSRVAPT
jgi:hypothetical protein